LCLRGGHGAQKDRNALLAGALTNGHMVYTGDRTSSTGKTIHLREGLLFNLVSTRGVYAGQAVLIENVTISD
jgi:hypothetical protein